MRAPRYRFPDEVRSTTRVIATRMVDGGAIAQTPEQLDAWISGEPDVKAALERGGYNKRFGSQDLLPLLHVFVVQAGGPAPTAPTADAPPPRSRRGWPVGVVLIVLLLVVVAIALLS